MTWRHTSQPRFAARGKHEHLHVLPKSSIQEHTTACNMPIRKPIWSLNGTWTRLLSEERLRRSSHVLSIVNNTAYIFSGEVQPRQPIDDQLDILPLAAGNSLFRSGISLYSQSRCPQAADEKHQHGT